MRNTLLLLLITAFQTYAENSYSQNTRLSLDLKEVKIAKVLEEIESQSEFYFLFSTKLIDIERKVSVSANNQKISSILDNIFNDTNIEYLVYDRQIVLSPKEYISTMKAGSQQSKPITGTITDVDGNPLIGVTVIVKGSTQVTITDAEGKYSLSNVPENGVLVFSFVGMSTKEVVIGNQKIIDVVMESETIVLEDVVVVGYGAQKKVNLTGAVNSIQDKVLTGINTPNLTSALQGRAPGLFISQTSGRPGYENINMLIRGKGTMNDSDPLILIDGIVTSRMDDIPIQDIESVSVLKDAASSAIYGAQAANGVILVTTKRGASGEARINYSSYYGLQTPINLPERSSSYKVAEMTNESFANEGRTPLYTQEEINKFRTGEDPYNYPNTDWFKACYNDRALSMNQYLSINGGTDKATYRISLGYLSQDGLLVKNQSMDRYNFGMKLDGKGKDWLKTGVSLNLSQQNMLTPVTVAHSTSELWNAEGNYDVLMQTILGSSSTSPVKYANGEYNNPNGFNPLANIMEGGSVNENLLHLIGSTYAEIKILKGLTLKGVAGIDYNSDEGKKHLKTMTTLDGSGKIGTKGPNKVTDRFVQFKTITLQSFLRYEKKFEKHNLNAFIGYEFLDYVNNAHEVYRQDFPSDELNQINAGSRTNLDNSGSIDEVKAQSYFGRINYDYDGKYLLEANLRRDASSKFSPDYRVGYFPSFSAGWRISNESFFSNNVDWISNLKLRASWGQLGNNNVPNFVYVSRITLGENYNRAGIITSGASVTDATNVAIRWESTSEFNIGFDVNFFGKQLLFMTVDYYDKLTDGILINVPVSQVFGLDAPITNAGAMRNKGLELSIGHDNSFGDFRYQISGNFAYNDNMTETFPNPEIGDRIRMEGYPWEAFYGLDCIGIFQTDADALSNPTEQGFDVKAGDLQYRDVNKDSIIDFNDRVLLGNSIPNLTFGADIALSYKNFDFSMFFQGVSGAYRYLDDVGEDIMLEDYTSVVNGIVTTEGFFPRLLASSQNNNSFSNKRLFDASYIRLKNVQLGYTFPRNLTQKIKIDYIRAYISGQNLLTFTSFPSSYDPEMQTGTQSGSRQYYPQVAVYTFGLDINF